MRLSSPSWLIRFASARRVWSTAFEKSWATWNRSKQSLSTSPGTYAAAEKMFLTKSYRQRDEAYATFVASVGDGTAPCLEHHALTKPDREQRAIALEPIKQVFHAADAAAGASRRARLLPARRPFAPILEV